MDLICAECRTELDTGAALCPECGARAPGGEPAAEATAGSDWRNKVRDTVARHREKKRLEQEKADVSARQLSIFPEEALEGEEERALRQRRAEIRARVQDRISKRAASPPRSRVVDAGEIPLRAKASGAATARKLATEPRPEPPDPRTAEFEPLTSPSSRTDIEIPVALPEPAEAQDALVTFGLASPWERAFSGLIDLVFVSLIQLTLFYLTTHLVAQRLGALPQSALGAMGLVGSVMAAGYFLFFWSLSGQTLGKLLTGSRVVDRRGAALGFGRAALRLAATLIAVLPLGAGFIGLFTDPECRGWHDRIAGTKVIRG